MVQILRNLDIGGDVAKAFSTALSEQLPKNLESGQLSQAYKNFKETGDLERLLAIPGAAEKIGAILPYARTQLERDAYQKMRASQGMPPNAGQANAAPLSPGESVRPAENIAQVGMQKPSGITQEAAEIPSKNVEEARKPSKFFLTGPELAASAKTRLQPAKTREVQDLAAYYRSFNPLLNESDSLVKAEEDLNRDYKAQEANILKAGTIAEEGLKNILQIKNLQDYSKLEGSLLEKIKSKLEADVYSGMTPEEAWQNTKETVSTIANDLAKLRSGSLGGQKAEDNIKSTYLRFKNLGLEDRFPAYASEIFNIPIMAVAEIVEPVKNAEFKKNIPSSPRIQKANYNKLAESIQPEDNINSMMNYLDNKHMDVGKFKDAIQNNEKVMKRLTRLQEQQLLEPVPTISDRLDKEFFKYAKR